MQKQAGPHLAAAAVVAQLSHLTSDSAWRTWLPQARISSASAGLVGTHRMCTALRNCPRKLQAARPADHPQRNSVGSAVLCIHSVAPHAGCPTTG